MVPVRARRRGEGLFDVPYENETWWQDVEGVAVIPVLYVHHRGETARQHKRMNIAAMKISALTAKTVS